MSESLAIKISIVIPVKDGKSTIISCLDAIYRQTLISQTEIIIIDSGSTDGTLDILKTYPVRLYQIAPEAFNHGSTRQYGVSLTKGEFVVMTVQDAIATDNKWLEKMIRHFEEGAIAGVCGQQIIPHHKDKNPHQWFRPVNPSNIERISFNSATEFDSLTPVKKKQVCSWDDVNAMYRKSVLESTPFREAFFAEDAIWAQDALRAGHVLIYDKSARVYHYHFQNYLYTYQRILTQLYFSYKIFGLKQNIRCNQSEYFKVIYRNFKYKAHPKWIWHQYRIMQARNKAFKDFNNWLECGDKILDENYQAICKTPPIGKVKLGQ